MYSEWGIEDRDVETKTNWVCTDKCVLFFTKSPVNFLSNIHLTGNRTSFVYIGHVIVKYNLI